MSVAGLDESIHRLVENWRRARKKTALKPTEVERYEVAAQYHEHLVAKYCTLLGTTLSGVVSFEDRIAVRYLRSRTDVRTGPVGCVGLSGGGCRAALLQATCDEIGAAVIVGIYFPSKAASISAKPTSATGAHATTLAARPTAISNASTIVTAHPCSTTRGIVRAFWTKRRLLH